MHVLLSLALLAQAPMVETETLIPMGNLEQVVVLIEMDHGAVVVKGSGSNLLQGIFASLEGKEPAIEVERNEGYADVCLSGQGATNEWTVGLADEVPIELEAEIDQGSAHLFLDGVKAQHLNVHLGQGEAVIDASGIHDCLRDACIGVGKGRLQALWTGTYPMLTELEIEGDATDIDLDLAGHFLELNEMEVKGETRPLNVQLCGEYAKLEQVRCEATEGAICLDLDGTWTRDCAVEVVATAGRCQLQLPTEIGVLVKCSSATGCITASGLETWELKEPKRQAKRKAVDKQMASQQVYVNSAYQKSPITLTISVQTTDGDIALASGEILK